MDDDRDLHGCMRLPSSCSLSPGLWDDRFSGFGCSWQWCWLDLWRHCWHWLSSTAWRSWKRTSSTSNPQKPSSGIRTVSTSPHKNAGWEVKIAIVISKSLRKHAKTCLQLGDRKSCVKKCLDRFMFKYCTAELLHHPKDQVRQFPA